MKLQDLSINATTRFHNADEYCSICYGFERNKAFSEVGQLLNARTANKIFDCGLLARDEVELANHIIDKLDINPHYEPSMTVLQAIRSINAKLALCNGI